MSSSRAVFSIGLSLALFCGFLAGAILAPFRAEASDAASSVALGSALSTDAREERLGALDSQAGSRFDRRDKPAEILPAEALSEERVAALSASFAHPGGDEPAGGPAEAHASFVLEGRIATLAGEPLEGVQVRTIPANLRFESWDQEALQRSPDGRATDRSLQSAVRAAAERFSRIERDARETRSDAQGAFKIENLRSGIAHSLEANLAGWEIADTDGSPWVGVTPGTPLTLVAKRLLRVPLRVEDGSGSVLESAAIHFQLTEGWVFPRLWQRATGAIWIPAGQYGLLAHRVPPTDRPTPTVNLTLEDGAGAADIVLRFGATARLEGRLQAEHLVPAERKGLSVRLVPHENGVAPVGERLRWNGQLAEIQRSPGGESYRALDLELGKYTLAVLLGEARILLTREVEIGAGTNRVDLEIPSREGDRVVEARVADAEGRGIPDVQLWAGRQDSADTGVVVLRADDSRSLWRIVHEARSLESPGAWQIYAVSPRHGRLKREYDPRLAGPLELRFAAPAQLEVQLPEPQGAMLTLIQPSASGEPGEEENLAGDVAFDRDGRAMVGPFAPGHYVLQLDMPLLGWSSVCVLRREIDLVAGANRVDLSLPPLYAVDILVPGFAGQTSHLGIEFRSPDGRESSFGIGIESERVRLATLPVGRYVIELAGEKPELTRRAEFAIPGATEVVLDRPAPVAPALAGIALTTLELSSRAASLGLQPGDVLVGIAGRSLEDPETAWAILVATPHFVEGESYAVEVVRRGQRLELSLPRELFLDPRASGLGESRGDR